VTISNRQLTTWTNQGATTTAANTHHQIRDVLRGACPPTGIPFTTYLQGSYRNNTNIRGDSDVDIVVEFNQVVVHPDAVEQEVVAFLQDCRKLVDVILVSRYGRHTVDNSRPNALKVVADNHRNRLWADVVVCATYAPSLLASDDSRGIIFQNQKTGQRIINHPKRHYDNGAAKNDRCNRRFKPAVRMFKNARTSMCDSNHELLKTFTSYGVECLLYNVPDLFFVADTWQDVFTKVVDFLSYTLRTDNASRFTTVSGKHCLFGAQPYQWNIQDAQNLVANYNLFWKYWYG